MSELTHDWYNHQIAIVNRRNAELEQELATARQTIERLKADKKALVLIADSRQATIERLSAPVSDAEWITAIQSTFTARSFADKLIAARSNDKEKA
jgi:predicted  nucleic acid-binding Zn-ribbon protein